MSATKGGSCDKNNNDSDGDSIVDLDERRTDSDDDGRTDRIDNDDDGDGLRTAFEGTGNPDEDDLPNYLDIDSDGDGRTDFEEGLRDDDCDGVANWLDHQDADGPCAEPSWADLPDDAPTSPEPSKPEKKTTSCATVNSKFTGIGWLITMCFISIFRRSQQETS